MGVIIIQEENFTQELLNIVCLHCVETCTLWYLLVEVIFFLNCIQIHACKISSKFLADIKI